MYSAYCTKIRAVYLCIVLSPFPSMQSIPADIPKGERDRYKALAARLGISVNQLFVQAVEQFIADNIGTLNDIAAVPEESDK